MTTPAALRLTSLTSRPCDGRWASPPCTAQPHLRGTASFDVAEDLRLDVAWHYDDGPDAEGLTVEGIRGSAMMLFGGDLPLTDRVYDAIWTAISTTV